MFFCDSEFQNLVEATKKVLSDDEKKAAGYIREDADAHTRAMARKALTEDNIAVSTELMSVDRQRSGDRKDLKPYQGKESDAELTFIFEHEEDARALYNFVVEAGILYPGEVVLRLIEGQNSVHFQPHVAVMMPDVILGVLKAYDDIIMPESREAYENLVDGLGGLLGEGISVSGAPKRTRGNPFHSADDGKFASRQELKGGKEGSWSYKKTKLKLARVKKSKKGDVLHFASTKRPCGRNARKAGKDVKCSTGKRGAGIAEAFMRKISQEVLTHEDREILAELRAKYGHIG